MPIAPADHLTSSVYIQASRLAKNDSNTAILPALSVVGARFARWLPPNFCVQLSSFDRDISDKEIRNDGVDQTELKLFLSDEMRNSIPMAFVFKMRLTLTVGDLTAFKDRHGEDDPEEVPTESMLTAARDDLASLLSSLHKKILHINALDLQVGALFGAVLNLAACVAALPLSLQSLTLSLFTDTPEHELTVDQVRALAAMPNLQELRLRGCILVRCAFSELFRPEKPAADSVFFPGLLQLEAEVGYDVDCVQFLAVTSKSLLLPQLTEFSVDTQCSSSDVDFVTLNSYLASFSHVRVFADFFCARLRLTGDGSLQVSLLATRVGENFMRQVNFGGHALNLHEFMPQLQRVGRFFLAGAQNIKDDTVKLPLNLLSFGPDFAAESSITELDFSPVAHSLECINLDFFAAGSELIRFDTMPFAACTIIGNSSDSMLFGCPNLREVNLSGLRGLGRRMGPGFLAHCSALVRITGMEGLMCAEAVDNYFLAFTTSLVECDFRALQSLRQIGKGCLHDSRLEEAGNKIINEILERNKKTH